VVEDRDEARGEGRARYEKDTALPWVLAGLALGAIAIGVFAYARYAGSEAYIAHGIEQMKVRGPSLDAEGCVDAVLGWAHDCDVHDTNSAVCEQGVKILMFHCLDNGDEAARKAECDEFLSEERAQGKWVWKTCESRGMRCVNKRECNCAEAFRSFESYCRTGGEAVQL
jgi:hypothetical protein